MIKVEQIAQWAKTLSKEDKEKLLNDKEQAVEIVSKLFNEVTVPIDLVEILLSDRNVADAKEIAIKQRQKEIYEEINKLKAEDVLLTRQLDAVILLREQNKTDFATEMDRYKQSIQKRYENKAKAKEKLINAVIGKEKMTVEEVKTLEELTKPEISVKPKKAKIVK